MKCKGCSRVRELVARGYCAACYQRWSKTGTTEYQRWGKRNKCQIKGCGKQSVSHGLCDTHRKRLERHNDVERGRPDAWGSVAEHPLKHSWKWMKRHASQYPIDPRWANDFLQFAVDVGERPSKKHKLFVADDSKPIGPDNFVWKRSVTEKADGEDNRTYFNRAHKVYRAVRKEAFQGYELKKHYGMSIEQYQIMLSAQNCVCAICGGVEKHKIMGRLPALAVDHCHTSGKIRGLLCSDCNRGLGFFKDSVKLLSKASDYLSRSRPVAA